MEKSLFDDLKVILFHYRWPFTKATLMVLISNFLMILNPLVFRQAVMALDPSTGDNAGILGSFFHFTLGHFQKNVLVWGGILLLLTVVSAVFKYLMRVAFISISRDVEMQVRSKLFDRIQNQSMAFFSRYGIGELLSRLTNDISVYRDVLGPGVMYPIYFLTLVIPGLFALYTISAKLTIISLIPLFAIPLLNAAVRNHIYQTSRLVQNALGHLSTMVQEHYSGIRIVKSYVVENVFYMKFKILTKNLAKKNLKLTILQSLLYPFFTLTTKVVTVLLVLFSGIIILRPWGHLGVADFVSFMWLQSYIFLPILMLGWVLPVYERGKASYERLIQIYNEPIEVQELPNSKVKIPFQADIVLQNLTFHYPESSVNVLSNINLNIKGGSFIGITGPIGSGKTTLFRLLNREYEVPKGMIFIGGYDIHEYSLAAFRSDMVTVEQIPFLFSQTIAENILFALDEGNRESLEVVARHADLHDTVLEFPEQYETMIGERGVTLSGGQKQRVAMARAFLVNRSILLLDDIFSAVDSATEKRIFASIRERFKDKTILLISHRISLLDQTDRVVYLHNGTIVEEGTPSTLMGRNGHYAALAQLQRLM
jgi:ATP-binding cassette, subfamily B, multidrug efflux pump